MAPVKRKSNEEKDGEASRLVKKAKPLTSHLLPKEEPDFPRGGANALTPLEHKQIHRHAKEDILFEQATGKRAPRPEYLSDDEDEDREPEKTAVRKQVQKSKGKKKPIHDGLPLKRLDKAETIRIEGLSYKTLTPGSLVLGQVSEINKNDIGLSLPNNLTGYVSLLAISDLITQKIEDGLIEDQSDIPGIDLGSLFRHGQYLRAHVLSTETQDSTNNKNKRHISLSLNPRLTNHGLTKSNICTGSMIQASVQSVEDHGLVMDIGLQQELGLKGFISLKEVDARLDISNIQEGTVFSCLVVSNNPTGKTINLSMNPTRIGSVKKDALLTDPPTIDSVLPGAAVEVLLSEVTATGIAGKIVGLIDATADFVHCRAVHGDDRAERKLQPGNKVKARVICTFPTAETKKLGVSFQEHILDWRQKDTMVGEASMDPSEVLATSAYVEHATVTKIIPMIGLFLDLHVPGVHGFVHISKLSDKKVDILGEESGPYKLESSHRARVIGYNSFDGLFIVSLQQSILDRKYMRIQDVPVGSIVKGIVNRMIVNSQGIGGLIVDLSEGVSGLVPASHLSDIQLLHPERKFTAGSPVTARVLSKDSDKHQLRFTLKKALLNSEEPPWVDYQSLKPGFQGPGTLINILPSGAVVQFYGDVRAFLPASEMSETYIGDPREHFKIGQVVRVRIVSVDVASGRMTVSCKDATELDEQQLERYESLEIGDSISGTITEKTHDTLVLMLENSQTRALLPMEHLTDGSAAKASSALKRLRVGQIIRNLIVLDKNRAKHTIQISSKPSLVRAAEEGALLKEFEAASEGAEVVGYVNNITAVGVFVQFGGRLTALLLKAHLPADQRKTIDFGLRKGQSISARILSIDQSRNRILLTQRSSSSSDHSNYVNGSDATQIASSKVMAGVSPSSNDYVFGKTTKARITSVKETQLNVELAEGIFGRVDVSSIFDSHEDIKDRRQPLSKFHVKELIDVRILGIHDSRNHRFLPITHRAKAPVFELTAKPSDLKTPEPNVLQLDQIQTGSTYLTYVNNLTDNCIWVNLSPNVRGRILTKESFDGIMTLDDMTKRCPPGSVLEACVKKIDLENGHLDLSTRMLHRSETINLKNLCQGQILPGRVTKVTERAVMVQLSDELSGPIHLVDLADDYSKANPWLYKKNQIIRVSVKEIDAPNKRVTLSVRPAQVLSSSLPVEDPDLAAISEVAVGDVRRGFVKNVADHGLFISLSSKITAFVRVANLSDLYVKDWKSSYEIDQLMTGKIIAVDANSENVQMSLKQSHLDAAYKPPLTFGDIAVGQVLPGVVRKVEPFGVFVVLDGSANVSGLCHRSQMSDEGPVDPTKLYEPGDKVQTKVLKIDTQKRQISLGLKTSFFDTAEHDMIDQASSGDELSISDIGNISGRKEITQTALAKKEPIEAAVMNGASSDEEYTAGSISEKARLETGAFDWTRAMSVFDRKNTSSDSDDSEAEGTKPALVEHQKRKKKAVIQVDQTGDLDANGPQSSSDFERLLLGQPNSSLLWLSYMAHQLESGEISAARQIAERALKTIHIREETEKLNVWVGMLNLENTYGDETSLEDVFQRACQHNDSEDIHERLISIYIQSDKHRKADDLLQAAVKKFTQHPSLYINFATFLMSTLDEPERARTLLPRALQALPSHSHLAITTKFAQLEFNSAHGDPERGRTMFETLLSQWPKRLDLWNILLDLEMKLGNQDSIRRIFERVTKPGSSVKPKKAKYFFKRWLEYEEKHGDLKHSEKVKALAMAYVSQQKDANA